MNSGIGAWKFVCAALAPGEPETIPLLRQLIAHGDDALWADVVRVGDAHLVTPGVWCGLVGKGVSQELPEDIGQYLSALYQMNRDRNTALLGQLDEIVEALNDAGIVPLLLKGAAYLQTEVYTDVGERILGDLDLLVDTDQIPEAFGALTARGYDHDDDWSHNRHGPRLRRQGEAAVVEIHWRHFRDTCDEILPTPTIWRHAIEKRDAGRRFFVPSPTDTVLASFLHSQIIDGLAERFIIGLRSLQDLVHLEGTYSDQIDWDHIRAVVGEHGEMRAFRDYVYAARRFAPHHVRATSSAGIRERLHYEAALARLRWRRLEYLCERYNGLFGFELKARYGPTDSGLRVHFYRMRAVGEWMLGRRWDS